ncbi:MAG: hypothetical protein L0I94_02905 [Yaniella sp.]|uniref:hypothetical protein n=1 Tax=Yaniella sp. TaxID=2773929 RepID=UPI002647B6CB|nr:hypothetical protein [Yaniella sp.]MDN6458166.1 hypothetical protein [Bifidobacterium crudilactis]MDN6527799.1 hypothetical protein [Brevibacterium sp.]MDN6147772.1 hypothetical protein [Yaniella sp.]MDN6499556.1 hypothetical protein [Yaniella sp.]MDN6757753.1 hypothetical protein [Yaniella sp.]
MTDYGHTYVIDNNALTFLKPEHRSSNFFKQKCRIPSEVLYEARGFPDIEELTELEYPTTASVLTALIEIMSSVPSTDTKLVNLYANQGNADPMVVACALDGQRKDESALFGSTWVVVSGDKAVQAKAHELKIEVRSNHNFLAVLMGRTPESAKGDRDE